MTNNRIKKEYRKITGLELIERQTNFIDENIERKDMLFENLSRLAFDRPEKFRILRRKVGLWPASKRNETFWALAGMVHYLGGEFGRARRAFFEALKLNPQNVDNWVDLAFSLRHCGKVKLGVAIFFNLEYLIHYYQYLKLQNPNLKTLENLILEINRRRFK
jgi:tetratricopeptide (TPR) repeat protein